MVYYGAAAVHLRGDGCSEHRVKGNWRFAISIPCVQAVFGVYNFHVWAFRSFPISTNKIQDRGSNPFSSVFSALKIYILIKGAERAWVWADAKGRTDAFPAISPVTA